TASLVPGSSRAFVEPLYRGNALSQYANELVARAARAHVESRVARGGRRVRLVEIGGGTAGTTRTVLEHLRLFAADVQYLFTDISRAFVRLAQQRLGRDYAFLDFGELDVERAPSEQGFNPGDVDIVIATNVLHATARLPETLRHVRSLLKPHGWLLLNEITCAQTFLTLTFGLLDGWWKYNDEENRLPLCPLTDVGGWSRLLAQAGFSRVECLDGGATAAPGLPQHVIVAESDAHIPIEEAINRGTECDSDRIRVACAGQVPTPRAARREPEVRDRGLALLTAETADCLGLSASDTDTATAFVEIGIDSILGVELVGRINRRLETALPATVLFDHPTIESLTDHIVGEGIRIPAAGALPTRERAVSTPPRSSRADVAIIGMAGRFPGADNVDAFWENLAAGKCSVTDIPPDRWDVAPVFDPTPQSPGRTYCRRGGFLSDIDRFDPLFFSMSGHDAELCDPQQRLFLEECWTALEDAAYAG